jgi:hypothetical protein
MPQRIIHNLNSLSQLKPTPHPFPLFFSVKSLCLSPSVLPLISLSLVFSLSLSPSRLSPVMKTTPLNQIPVEPLTLSLTIASTHLPFLFAGCATKLFPLDDKSNPFASPPSSLFYRRAGEAGIHLSTSRSAENPSALGHPDHLASLSRAKPTHSWAEPLPLLPCCL